MAFQAMNHGLEARATSPHKLETIHNSKTDRALVPLQPLICGCPTPPPSSPQKGLSKNSSAAVTAAPFTKVLRPLKGSVLGVSDSWGIARCARFNPRLLSVTPLGSLDVPRRMETRVQRSL